MVTASDRAARAWRGLSSRPAGRRAVGVARATAWQTTDFYCRKLSGDVYLLTYTLLQDDQRLTRRSEIWQRTADGWKNIYHQGTVVQDV